MEPIDKVEIVLFILWRLDTWQLVLPRDLVVVPRGGPGTKDECKDGGWRTFAFPRTFKNQGDSIQFVNTRK